MGSRLSVSVRLAGVFHGVDIPLITYQTYEFKPWFDNFMLEYEVVRETVSDVKALYLHRPDIYYARIEGAQDYLWKHHTWTARAKTLADAVS